MVLDIPSSSGIIILTSVSFSGGAMPRRGPDLKEEALRAARALNPQPEAVVAPVFAASDFFDARDVNDHRKRQHP
jgi:hypothetical protein